MAEVEGRRTPNNQEIGKTEKDTFTKKVTALIQQSPNKEKFMGRFDAVYLKGKVDIVLFMPMSDKPAEGDSIGGTITEPIDVPNEKGHSFYTEKRFSIDALTSNAFYSEKLIEKDKKGKVVPTSHAATDWLRLTGSVPSDVIEAKLQRALKDFEITNMVGANIFDVDRYKEVMALLKSLTLEDAV